jgi:hypothetical protein
MEIADPGSHNSLLETDHLPSLPSRARRVEDKLFVGRVLPQALENFERPRS